MPEYCTETDVRNRLTANGYLNLGDRDGDGIVNASEVSASITSAIWRNSRRSFTTISP